MMASVLELGSELLEVVNFSVENDPDGSVLVKHRLVASSQIDDAKAAHTEARSVFDEDAFVIRTAVHNSLAHAVNRGCFNSLVGSRAYDSGDSAHALSSPAHLGICALA
jgi:hypothetical protein